MSVWSSAFLKKGVNEFIIYRTTQKTTVLVRSYPEPLFKFIGLLFISNGNESSFPPILEKNYVNY